MFSFFLSSSASSDPFLFRKCSNMRFCRDNRKKSTIYSLDSNSIKFDSISNTLYAELSTTNKKADLSIQVSKIKSSGFHFLINSLLNESFRYDTLHNEYVIDQDKIKDHAQLTYSSHSDHLTLSDSENTVTIFYSPLNIQVTDKNGHNISINSHNNILFEHGDSTISPETNHNFRDSIPHGGTAVGIDFTFSPETSTGNPVYFSGLSERAGPLNLPDTFEEESPIRLYCSDAFEYEAENTNQLYGNIPFLIAHSSSFTAGLFWLNPSDTFVDFQTYDSNERSAHFLSEGGFLNFIVFTGELPEILSEFTFLTGKPDMAPIFAFGYHQSRWGYMSQNEVEIVMRAFNNDNIPYDSIWLDVDHLEGKTPFSVNKRTFPDINGLARTLGQHGRALVRLCDPHLPYNSDLPQFKEARKSHFLVLSNDKTPYIGEVWPGQCVFVDFMIPSARNWWSSQFQYGIDGIDTNVFFWNDMNEPSIFRADQATFAKDLLHKVSDKFYEDREVHSLYGLLNAASTYKGLIDRNPDKNLRPFVLTRSYFAGSQKYAWTWSGDNTATWEHLQASIPMLLASGLCGMPFSGADVGGFLKSVDPDLLARWFQVGSWIYPFFREHCHHKSARREPFLFDGENRDAMISAISDRYHMLAFWYTAAIRTHYSGLPIVEPIWMEFPNNSLYHEISSEVILDSKILVAPVIEEEAEEITLSLPSEAIWYRFRDGKIFKDGDTMSVNISTVPVFVRDGSIIPEFIEIGESAYETLVKPIRLYVFLDENGNAEGDLYLDDGTTYNFSKYSEYMHRIFKVEGGKLKSFVGCPDDWKKFPEMLMNNVMNEVIVFSPDSEPKKIENLNLKLIDNWEINI